MFKNLLEKDIKVDIASNKASKETILYFIARVYNKKGFIKDKDVFVEGEKKKGGTYLATSDKGRIGSCCILREIKDDFPMIDDLTTAGIDPQECVEITRLCSEGGIANFLYLFREAFRIIKESGKRYLVIIVHPKHTKFYLDLFPFDIITCRHLDSYLQGVEASLLVMDLRSAEEKMKDLHQSHEEISTFFLN